MGIAAPSLHRLDPGGRSQKSRVRVQKAKAPWAMQAAWDRGEEYYDPARKEDMLGRTKTRLELRKEHLKDPLAAESLRRLEFGFTVLSLPAFVVAMAFSIAGAKIFQKMWEGLRWEGIWPYLDPWDVVRLRTSSSVWSVPGKYGPRGELFFFPTPRLVL